MANIKQNNLSKADLITALSAAMGKETFEMAGRESSFDPSTQTLYCHGSVINGSTIEEALEFFKGARAKNERLATTDEGVKKMNTFYQVAIEAIQMMLDGGNEGQQGA